MAFNNRTRHYQMPGAFPGAERDEFGYTEADYVQMMDDVASKYIGLREPVDSRITRCSQHR